jgi:hypothetical protein
MLALIYAVNCVHGATLIRQLLNNTSDYCLASFPLALRTLRIRTI